MNATAQVSVKKQPEHLLAYRAPSWHFYRKAFIHLNTIQKLSLADDTDRLAVAKSVKKLKRQVLALAAGRVVQSFVMYNAIHLSVGYQAYNPSFSDHQKTVENAPTISRAVVDSIVNVVPEHKKGVYAGGAFVVNYSLAATRMVLEQYMLNKRGINMDVATQLFGSYGAEAINQVYKLSTTNLADSNQALRFHATSAWGEIVRMTGDLVMLAAGSKFSQKILHPLTGNKLNMSRKISGELENIERLIPGELNYTCKLHTRDIRDALRIRQE